MISDEKRREAASRLRESAEHVSKHDDIDCVLNDILRGEEKRRGINEDCAVCRRATLVELADLIEPSGHECVPGGCPLNVRHDNDRIDRDALLAIATVMAADSVRSAKQGSSVSPVYILHAARDIAEACGETFGSIRNRELAEWGTSIVPKETIVDRDALLELADELDKDADNIINAARDARFTGGRPRMGEAKSEAYERRSIARRIREAVNACEGDKEQTAPVIAADGRPLELGQTVYATRYGYARCTVLSFEWMCDGWLVEVENEGGHKFRQTPDEFTHKRPVLDADDRPLHEGEIVYKLDDDKPYTLKRFDGDHVYINAGGSSFDIWTFPNKLTHERPIAGSAWRRTRERLLRLLRKHPLD